MFTRWSPAIMALTLGAPLHAEPAPLTPADYAPAIQVQDVVAGAYEIVHSPELGQIFIASTPAFEAGTPGYIHVLDDKDLHQIRQIQLTRRAFGLALDHETGRLYVGHTLDGALGVLDARGGLLLDVVQLGQKNAEGDAEHTRMIALDEANGRAFITSPSEKGVVWLVDTRTNTLLQRVEGSGLWSAGAVYNPRNGSFYSSGGGMEEIGVFDAETGQRSGSISTGDTTEEGDEASKHFLVNLAIDVETQRLFAADANSGSLYVFDIATGKILGQTPIGAGTLDVAFNDARQEVYLTYRGASREAPNESGGVVVIDAGDYSVKQRLPMVAHPNSLEVSADGQVLYMTIKAPHADTHPAYRAGALDSVVRIDLPMLIDARN